MLVGNKADLEKDKNITEEAVQEFITMNCSSFIIKRWICSAKTGEGVYSIF